MPIDLKKLDRALNPKTVAVVGDSGRRGYNWLNSMKTAAKLYSVQLDENEIPGIEAMGIPNYKSLTEIPDDIDYNKLSGLSNEVKSKFKLIKPKTLGQALRIDGITPAAAYILLSHVKKGSKKNLKRA